MQDDRTMRRLWLRMGEIYGAHRWTAAYGEDATRGAGCTWAKGLAGLTPADLARGVETCITRASEWPPSLGEFRALCMGVPTLAECARQLACGAVTPFARLVWQHLDSYRYRRADAREASRLLREAYELARDHVTRGGDLPAEPAGVLEREQRDFRPAEPSTVAAAMAEMAAALGPHAPSAEP